ncbi:aminoglycoside phosphotransferase family protein [Micromonospora radicis]|uniref:Aminoglycoside phosphotransferase family protein n=1 Tax=Micromonospora radicis TaxID=1894971 RepID=A0A418MMS8_9ACTN|nr:aminoglycoside phosphotransferase family protein [Micromonospora radicis]RIV30248.1 aminoglycoside phosphotransferase family protein [Micromonospora radicis]
MTEQQEFRGGVNVVRRHGDVVHRPASPAAPAIHRLLRHLHDRGFHGAPQPRGFDSEGNEILTFLDGEVPDVLTPELRTPEFLATAAALLRGLHDASVTFRPRPDDPWIFPVRQPAEVMCHGDVAQYNSVVKDGLAVGFIDFDAAHPGPRIWDVAYAVYRFAPLQGPDNPESFGTPQEQGRRAAEFCRAYGPEVGAEVVDVVPDRLQALIDFMRDQAGQGNEAFQQHIAQGHTDLYEADIRYVRAHRDMLRAAFTEG